MKCRTNDRHCIFEEKHSIFFPDGLVTYGVKMSSTVNTYSCTDTRGQNQIKMSFDMVKQHAVTHSRLIFKKLCVLFLQTGNRSGRCCIMHSVSARYNLSILGASATGLAVKGSQS